MRLIRSKYAGKCRICGEPYAVGESVWWERGKGAWHRECRAQEAPVSQFGPDWTSADEADYQRGVAEANAYLENKRLFGEEVADRWELERELREGWDY